MIDSSSCRIDISLEGHLRHRFLTVRQTLLTVKEVDSSQEAEYIAV